MNVGDTFFLITPNQHCEHLYVIIYLFSSTDYLTINITKEKYDSDCACQLKQGDHSFIKENSVIYYEGALKIDEQKLNSAIGMGLARICNEPFRADIMQRILDGVCLSESLPLKFKKLFNCP